MHQQAPIATVVGTVRNAVLTLTLSLWAGGRGVSGRRVQGFSDGLSLDGGLLQSGHELYLDGHVKLVERLDSWQLHEMSANSDAKTESFQEEVPAAIKAKMEVGTRLGQGVYGEAWRARDEQGKDVVYKFFYKDSYDGSMEYLTSETATSRETRIMRQEVRACDAIKLILEAGQKGKIQHPGARHICKCMGYQNDAKALFIKQEFCGKKNLKEWRFEGKAERRWYLARKMTYQIVTALSLFADTEYMHHDLKPANVVVSFVDEEPIAKLVDWGGMRKYEDFDTPCLWTSLYAPIELRYEQQKPCAKEGREYTYDMFAAGAIFAELLTGEEVSVKKTGAIDWEKMKDYSDGFWDAPGSPATKLMQWMTQAYWQHRPHPRAVVLDQAFLPWGLSFVTGHWQKPGMDRSFTISTTPGSVDFEFTLSVNAKDESRITKKVTKEDCDLRPRPKMCCRVQVSYSGSRDVEITLCSMSFWTMTFQEEAEGDQNKHSEALIEDVTEFRRTTAA